MNDREAIKVMANRDDVARKEGADDRVDER
jgi:hypothetical protein